MDRYTDNEYAIINGTLLACTDEAEKILIPASVNGHRIERIGAGCGISGKVRSVTVAEGIKQIGRGALLMERRGSDRPKMEMRLPSSITECELFSDMDVWKTYTDIYIERRFPADEYEKLLKESILLADGRRLIDETHGGRLAFSGEKGDFWDRPGWKCASYNPEMNGIYCFRSKSGESIMRMEPSEKGSFNDTFPEQLLILGRRKKIDIFPKESVSAFRDSLVEIMLKERQMWPGSSACELKNDEAVIEMGDSGKWVNSMLMICFDEQQSYNDRNDVVAEFHIASCYMYFTEMRKTVVSGKDYYIYCENWLGADRDKPFDRIEHFDRIYDPQGRRADADIAEKVRAKYKLISMLV